MRRAAILLLAVAACRAPRADGSGARVSVGPWTPVAERIVERVEPLIIAALGTSWPRPYPITIDWSYTKKAGYTQLPGRSVRIGPEAFRHYQALEFTLAHELVHVHMRGEWRELPPVLQEGVADWIASVVTCYAEPEWTLEIPEPEAAREVLTMPYQCWRRMSADEIAPFRLAAMYLASRMVRFPTLPEPFVVRWSDTPRPGEETPPWPPYQTFQIPVRPPPSAESLASE